MTLCERVRKLDEFYLAADKATTVEFACKNKVARAKLRRKSKRLWAKYTTLRDSKEGLK